MKVGDIIESNNYGLFEIIEFKPPKEVTIKFLNTQHVVSVFKGNAKHGSVRDPYARNYYGVGYIGDEVKYYRGLRSYDVWKHMMERCYWELASKKFPSYIGCTVCEEWQCYKVFKLWYESQPNNDNGELDKDLLIRGNKIYSPYTCTLVPYEVNIGLQTRRVNSGDYPVGVYYKKANRNYIAQLALGNGVQKHLGSFDTPTAAASVYKRAKEAQVRGFAAKYVDRLTPPAIAALLEWELE